MRKFAQSFFAYSHCMTGEPSLNGVAQEQHFADFFPNLPLRAINILPLLLLIDFFLKKFEIHYRVVL